MPDGEGWVVRRDGAVVDRAYTKGIAIESGQRRAKATVLGRLIIHGADGSIEAEHTYSRDARRSPGAGQKVLVIDDDPDIRRTVSRILRVGGYKPVEAVGGREGIDALMRGRFVLVITDLFMPSQDGIETIQRIRELEPDMPIIAISGAGDGDFSPLQDAKLMGANRIIAKPFTVDDILSAAIDLVGPS